MTTMEPWPSDDDGRRALEALEQARKGTRGPIPLQAMKKALIAGHNRPDTRTPDQIEYDNWLYNGIA